MITKQNNSYEESRSIFGDHHSSGNLRVKRKEKNGNPSIFITKTFQILEKEQFNEIAHWNLDGNSFIIRNVQKFEEQILPIYFRHRNFTSFVRQLNMYDFHKIRNQSNSNIFQHKQFRRHQRDNLKNIKRKGCTEKKVHYDETNDRFQKSSVDLIKSHKTVETSRAYVEYSETIIPRQSPSIKPQYKLNVRKPIHSPATSPFRKKLIEEFLSEVPEEVLNQNEMEQCIRSMKNNPKYFCLDNKEDLRKIVQKLKKARFCKTVSQDLEDLSIEEEIIVENIRGPAFEHPSLAIFSTEKFLPLRSISLIGSLNFGVDVENLLYTN